MDSSDQPFDIERPFTFDEGRAAGISERVLRSAEFFSVVPGVFVKADAPLTHLVIVRAALKYAPDGIVSGHSAAKLWNAIVPDRSDVELALPRTVRVQTRGIREHRPPVRPRWVRRFGVRVTPPAATFVRLAADLDLVDLVVAGDSLVRQSGVTPQELIEAAAASRGHRARLARRAARLVRAEVDSPRETVLRLLIVFAGMPEPEPNIVFHKPDGTWEYRLDMGHRAKRVAFEYDGRQHETPEHTAYDHCRRAVLEGREWMIHSVVSDDLFVSPDLTVDRLRTIHDELGIPHTPSLEWRRHFPVRRKAA